MLPHDVDEAQAGFIRGTADDAPAHHILDDDLRQPIGTRHVGGAHIGGHWDLHARQADRRDIRPVGIKGMWGAKASVVLCRQAHLSPRLLVTRGGAIIAAHHASRRCSRACSATSARVSDCMGPVDANRLTASMSATMYPCRIVMPTLSPISRAMHPGPGDSINLTRH